VNFDFVAPHYHWMEAIVFGHALQQARTYWIDRISRPERTLILGEGNGRFLCELLRVHPGIEVDCVDSSNTMLQLTRRRLLRTCPESFSHVHFFCEDVLKWSPQKSYDLLVTHFFLDCFPRNQLSSIVEKLANAATPNAAWLIADFTEPQTRFARVNAHLLLGLMYTFFGIAAGIAARELVDPFPYLKDNGFSRASVKLSEASLVRSDLYSLSQYEQNRRM
jgi:ubiquinone/menaquinone biosynthesis C-methylase UbiE